MQSHETKTDFGEVQNPFYQKRLTTLYTLS